MQSASGKTLFQKLAYALRLHELSPPVRKIIIGAAGGFVLLAGLAMVFLPGPAFVVIPLGLAILASEFAWARHYVQKARDSFERARKKWRNRKGGG